MNWRVAVFVLVVALVGGIVYLRTRPNDRTPSVAPDVRATCSHVQTDFSHRYSQVWVTLTARVVRLLPDSQGQYQHQRFIVQCPSGQTVLIVNDVSIGERAPVRIGQSVSVRGQFIWNNQGGLIHFTHHDPAGGEGGWIIDARRQYSIGSAATIGA
ncbi:MAG: DUF3465 domain-containing protein [Chloroflexota bacterium]